MSKAKKPGYLDEVIDFGGEYLPRGTAIAIMQSEGLDPRCIDRWLQGQEHSARLREAREQLNLKP